MQLRLFELMAESGITQLKLSKETGISTGNISDWKSGRSSPKADALCKIADYLGVSVDYLLGRTDAKALASDTPDPLLAVILERYEALNPEGREKLADLADDLAASGKYIKTNAPGLGASQI